MAYLSEFILPASIGPELWFWKSRDVKGAALLETLSPSRCCPMIPSVLCSITAQVGKSGSVIVVGVLFVVAETPLTTGWPPHLLEKRCCILKVRTIFFRPCRLAPPSTRFSFYACQLILSSIVPSFCDFYLLFLRKIYSCTAECWGLS